MQYILNQTEYDEYMMLKENSASEIEAGENRQLAAIMNMFTSKNTHLAVYENIDKRCLEFRCVFNSNDVPNTLQEYIVSKTKSVGYGNL